VVNLEQFRGLFAVEKRLKLRNAKPAVGFKSGGYWEKWACHIALLFLTMTPVSTNVQDLFRQI
jgi:hypothetical protein